MSSADIKSQRELNATCSLVLHCTGDDTSTLHSSYCILDTGICFSDSLLMQTLRVGLPKSTFILVCKKDQMKIRTTDRQSYFERNKLSIKMWLNAKLYTKSLYCRINNCVCVFIDQ